MSSIRIVRRRRRSRRRSFKVYRAKVVERLILRDDPNHVGRIIVQHEFALKRMYKASVPAHRAAVLVRRHCFDKHGVMENPVSVGGLPRGALMLGSAALVAVGVGLLAVGLSAYAKKQDAGIPIHEEAVTLWT